MTKHNEKYYLQYAAPGTQYNIYNAGNPFKDIAFRVFRSVKIAGASSMAGAEIHPVTYDAYVRCKRTGENHHHNPEESHIVQLLKEQMAAIIIGK